MDPATAFPATTPRQRTAFEEILWTLRTDSSLFKRPAYISIQKLLTLDGRLPIEHALDSLSDVECAVVSHLPDLPELRVAPVENIDGHAKSLKVFYNSLGRLHLRPSIQPLPSYPEGMEIHPIGYLQIPMVIRAWAQAVANEHQVEEIFLRTKIDEILDEKERRGHLGELIDDVDDHVRHVETVCIYVDDELFSVKERFTTLIGKDKKKGLLSSLRGQPLRTWTPAQRLGIAGLKALFLAGRSIRFEEFNGKEMTACRLFSRLNELASAYRVRGVKFDTITPADLFELAAAIGKASSESVGQPWLRYRWINGLTFFKTERLTCTPTVAQANALIPDRLKHLYERITGKTFDPSLGYENIFSELTDAAIGATPNINNFNGRESGVTPTWTPLEELIQEIVVSALLATKADYGMSSSLRDISPLLQGDYQTRVKSMHALKPADFYCCIVSRPGLSRDLRDQIQSHIYAAVQGRMQFNRWHFIAGNFPRGDIPQTRHYFYPPMIPDLAEWSDQHHGGHTRASVRYSIRSPGPDMGEPPLYIAGHPYRGFYDIRVVRMEGPPFELRDMFLARHHCLMMGVVWKRIVAHREARPDSLKIIGFQKGAGYEPEESRIFTLRQNVVSLSEST